MRSGNTNMKKRITGAILAGALAVSILGVSIFADSNKAHAARVTLRGIDELANKHSGTTEEGLDPFIILEIVDDLNDASIGYLVGGEEPVSDGKSIKDMPSKDEREAKLQAASPTYLADDGSGDPYAYTWTGGYQEISPADDANSMDIRGVFNDMGTTGYDYRLNTAGSGDYTEITFADEDALETFNSTQGDALYRKYKKYELESGTSGKILSLRIKPDTNGFMPYSINDDGIYTGILFKATEITSLAEIEVDQAIYSSANGEDLHFEGHIKTASYDDATDTYEITNDEDTPIVSDLETVLNNGEHLYSVDKTNDDSGTTYYINNVADGGPYSESIDYEQIYGTPGDYTTDDDVCPLNKGPYYYLNSGVSELEYEYDDTHSSGYDFEADYTKSVYDTFYYENGFANEEWFKKYVFDRDSSDEYKNLSVDVVTVLASELTEDLINKANLVYLVSASGITAENARALSNKVVDSNLPVIMEYSAYDSVYDPMDPTANADAQKLTLKLMQNTLTTSDDTEWGNLVVDPTDPDSLWKTTRFYNDLLDDNGNETENATTKDISYVKGTVFVNDDLYGGVDPVVSRDFYTEFDPDKISNGFEAVKAEIDTEKTLLEARGVWDQFNSKISKATAIRFILNANNNRIAIKDKLRILDIEPMQTSQYKSQGDLASNINYHGNTRNVGKIERDIIDNDWIDTYLIDTVSSSTDEKPTVELTQMGTKEFIGVNEDLNSTYDMIYIGMDTAIMNTKIENESGVNVKKLLSTEYNYSSMDGTVYSHMGDTISGYSNGRGGSGSKTLPGNDITADKLVELVDYIKAGYAVVISDGFVNDDGSINDKTVDKSSNMYKLMNWIINDKTIEIEKIEVSVSDGNKEYSTNSVKIADEGGRKYYGRNVQLRSNVEDNSAYRETLIKFLNISKLKINEEESSFPVAYNPGMNYLPINSSGGHSLDFSIKLENDSAIDASGSSYDCKLYVDMDADGKFEKAEELGGLSINNSAEVEDDGKYHLKAGNTYSISRDLPPEYVGFISWKLVFTQNETVSDGSTDYASGVRASVSGFSAVKSDKRPVIKVLQIVPNTDNDNINARNNLNLSSDVNAPLKGLYDDVQEFEIKVFQVTASAYILKWRLPNIKEGGVDIDAEDPYFKGTYYDFLSQFDMVVTGFVDMYEFVTPRNGDNGYDLGRDNCEMIPIANYADSTNQGTVRTEIINRLTANGIPHTTPWTGDIWIPRWAMYHDAILGIREYAITDHSILFTHDLTSFTEVEFTGQSWNTPFGYYANTYLRDIQGMDRYGYIKSEGISMKYYFDSDSSLEDYNSIYDKYERRGGTDGLDSKDRLAFTDSNILRFTTGEGANKLRIGATTRNNTAGYNPPNWWSGYRETVTAINEGQITQYPFLITTGTGGRGKDSSFETASTHPQYFQLNLDTNSSDDNDNDDVVVWYTISNTEEDQNNGKRWEYYDYYRANHNDARNNYYIFSKGNVVYTGAGHQSIEIKDSNGEYSKEAKLFVNTLVAAYNAGSHSPRVEFKQSGLSTAKAITSTILPFDPELANAAGDAEEGGFLDDTFTIFFKPTNLNFRDSGKAMYAKYYCEVSSGEAYDHAIIGGDGITHYLKELTPIADTMYKYLSNTVKNPVGYTEVDNGATYECAFNFSSLSIGKNTVMLANGKTVASPNKNNQVIYVRIGLEPISNATTAKTIPNNETMAGLNIYTSVLVDLK